MQQAHFKRIVEAARATDEGSQSLAHFLDKYRHHLSETLSERLVPNLSNFSPRLFKYALTLAHFWQREWFLPQVLTFGSVVPSGQSRWIQLCGKQHQCGTKMWRKRISNSVMNDSHLVTFKVMLSCFDVYKYNIYMYICISIFFWMLARVSVLPSLEDPPRVFWLFFSGKVEVEGASAGQQKCLGDFDSCWQIGLFLGW